MDDAIAFGAKETTVVYILGACFAQENSGAHVYVCVVLDFFG